MNLGTVRNLTAIGQLPHSLNSRTIVCQDEVEIHELNSLHEALFYDTTKQKSSDV